ncbi:RNA 2',3'-cyclic phosphodiesterase [Janthinobacterium aquaticum]|uniref:RNA 2',3'-cyclic phosphodiesterase n=1 Tax=Janthinobacterium sp. FT58W TaxID=2654254 RepID=UPI00186AE67C|nr:RNA 2',3'-cyclic phosphodiesterase [Janthinobacterium sp. FT58W]
MHNLSDTPRLFYALWPDADTASAFAALQPAIGGTPSRLEKLHLTLAFLGPRPASELPQLIAILQQLPDALAPLVFDRYGYFPKVQLSWAGLPQSSPALLALHADLMARLHAAQLAPAPETHGYTPHVTLARRSPPPPAEHFSPVIWHAGELVLAESDPASGNYRLLARRKLLSTCAAATMPKVAVTTTPEP